MFFSQLKQETGLIITRHSNLFYKFIKNRGFRIVDIQPNKIIIKNKSMKKIYLATLLLTSIGVFGQYQIDFDDMTPGAVSPQSANIIVWPAGGATDCTVSALQSSTNPHSMLVAEGGANDVLFLLGNQSTGTWTVSWNMYVVAGKTAYWNIQDSETAGVAWNADFFVGATGSGGSAGVITHDQSGVSIAYPEDTWFSVIMVVNLDSQTFTTQINGTVMLNSIFYIGTQLGSINFYSIDANNRYFIDDFAFTEGNVLSIGENTLTSTIDVFPNPASDFLHVNAEENISEIVVCDALGSVVMKLNPNEKSTVIDVQNFSTGVYFVNVQSGSTVETHRIIR